MLDFNKPITTRNGREVRIWTTEAKFSSAYPVRGEVLNGDGKWYQFSWDKDGKWCANQYDNTNLINPPQKKTVWVNFYRSGVCYWFESEAVAKADACSHSNTLAVAVAVLVEVEMP